MCDVCDVCVMCDGVCSTNQLYLLECSRLFSYDGQQYLTAVYVCVCVGGEGGGGLV